MRLTELRAPACPARVATERKKQAALDSVGPAAHAVMDALNADMSRVWRNQQRLDAQSRTLQRETKRFTAQSRHWLQMYADFHGALKALGDVENFVHTIEKDMAVVSATIDAVRERERDLGLHSPRSPAPSYDAMLRSMDEGAGGMHNRLVPPGGHGRESPSDGDGAYAETS